MVDRINIGQTHDFTVLKLDLFYLPMFYTQLNEICISCNVGFLGVTACTEEQYLLSKIS